MLLVYMILVTNKRSLCLNGCMNALLFLIKLVETLQTRMEVASACVDPG